MNWKIEYIEKQNFVKIVTEGDFTVSDHEAMIEDITSQKFWKPGMDTFFDNRKLEFNETTIELMKKVSENHKSHEKQIGGGKAAILMKSLVRLSSRATVRAADESSSVCQNEYIYG